MAILIIFINILTIWILFYIGRYLTRTYVTLPLIVMGSVEILFLVFWQSH